MNDDFLSSAQFQSPAEDSWLGSLGRGVAGQGFSWNAAVSTKPHLCPRWRHISEVRPAGKNLFTSYKTLRMQFFSTLFSLLYLLKIVTKKKTVKVAKYLCSSSTSFPKQKIEQKAAKRNLVDINIYTQPQSPSEVHLI